MSAKKNTILAFSGGLDTTFCLLYLQEKGHIVTTVTVDAGGFSAEALSEIATRAKALGAAEHITVDARERVYEDHIAYLIKGNVLRGGVYPLCVGAERVVQAREVARIANEMNADAIAHGSTGAGNDQIRFDVALKVLCPNVEVITPIRDEGWSREASSAWLEDKGVEVEAKTTEYSVNEGLWGATIGGKETHDSWEVPPNDAYVWTTSPTEAPSEGETFVIGFEKGLPATLNNEALNGVQLVTALNHHGGRHGVGRDIHVGDTIMGIKGRIAFEAPAAAILIAAHRELEKLVLSRWQGHYKAQLASFYGMLLHEAQYFDPIMRDIEAFVDSASQRVTGEVKVYLRQGSVSVVGARSKYSMMDAAAGTYGEKNTLWTGADARGFASIFGTQGVLAARAAKGASNDEVN